MTLLTCILFTVMTIGIFFGGFHLGVKTTGLVIKKKFPEMWETIKEGINK